MVLGIQKLLLKVASYLVATSITEVIAMMPFSKYPGEEICDQLDINCNGALMKICTRFFVDNDGDGIGRRNCTHVY